MCLDGECSWSRQYQDLPVWLPNGFNTGCQFTIPWGLVGTCWKVHIFVPKIKAGSYWYLSKWMKEASSRKRQTPTPFENEHVPWKGTISKGRKSTRDKSLRTSPGNSVGVRDFGNFRTQENESIYIKNLLDYYWHRTKNPLTSNSSFWRYVFCKNRFWPNTTTNISTFANKEKKHLPKASFTVVTHQADSWLRPFQGEFRCLAPSDVRKDLEACFCCLASGLVVLCVSTSRKVGEPSESLFLVIPYIPKYQMDMFIP